MAIVTFLTLFLLSSITTVSAIFWKDEAFFGNYDLHFVIVPQWKLENGDSLGKYFAHNLQPYNPLLLESVSYNQRGIQKKNKFWTGKGSPSNGRIRKLTHFLSLISLVDLKLGVWIRGQPYSFLLLHDIIPYLNPKYIFAQVDNPSSTEYLTFYTYHEGSAKLFLYSGHPPVVYIPCFVSKSCSPPVTRPVSMTTLNSLWNSVNMENMRNAKFATQDFNNHWYIKCGASERRFHILDTPRKCMVFTLLKKYNFTITQNPRDSYISVFINSPIYLIKGEERLGSYAIGKLEFEKFKFFVVTDLPSRMNTFEAFISPFDIYTWALILFCVFALFAFIFSDHYLMQDGNNNVVLAMFNVVTPLIGQVSDNVHHMFHCRNGGAWIWILWISFGGYILMYNLYQGSVYSCLTVKLPSTVPKSMTELRDSDISVITFSNVEHLHVKLPPSMLKYSAIPEMITTLGPNDSYAVLLSQLNYRIVHIRDALTAVRAIKGSQPVVELNNTVPTKSAVAVMDRGMRYQIVIQWLDFAEGRHLVHNNADTLLVYHLVWLVQRNFFLSRVVRHINQLEESGLLRRWTDLEIFKRCWNDIYTTLDDGWSARRWYTKQISGAKEQITFDEAGTVSLSVLGFVFVLWGGLLITGLVVLLLEGIKGKVVTFRGMVQLLFYVCRKISWFWNWIYFSLRRLRRNKIVYVKSERGRKLR